ncbi:MAG: biotin--[acetyl-CoA-carboxylase] ligase [Alphaproteobacteria bacterium]|nr:biotin--[acetyl-CoA-carboxylase] ligase [Alphaproteobacteria bacterium]
MLPNRSFDVQDHPVHLAPSVVAEGYRLTCFDSVASTNDEAMRLAQAGDAGRHWIVAKEQTGGRGRHQRHWVSPPGNLYASLLLIDPAPIALAPQLGFVAGLSLFEALHPLLHHDQALGIKWPNDLVIKGAKLAGILLEASRLADGRLACVLGFGVNCTSHPQGLAYPASDLTALGLACGAQDVLEALSHYLVAWLDKWARGEGFPQVRTAWLAHAAGLGGPIRVSVGSQMLDGIFRTIDMQGRLVMALAQGERSIEAGDVFLPGHHTLTDQASTDQARMSG